MRQRLACGVLVITALTAGAACAGDADKSASAGTSLNFGSRTDKPDGSSALTIGRRLPTEWETRVGTDVSLAPASSPVPSENLLHGAAPDQSSGSVWGSITMPGIRPLGFDKTAVEARIDGGKEEGKLGATLSRSVPLSRDLSVTWQNSYSVTQPLTQTGPVSPYGPLLGIVSPTGTITQPVQARVLRRGAPLQHRAVRYDLRGRHKFVIGRRPVAQQAQHRADLDGLAQGDDLGRGPRHRREQEEHHRGLQEGLVTIARE